MAQANGAGERGGAPGGPVATISAGIVVTGNVQCSGELQISGQVDGEVRCATIVIEASGVVRGGISADRLRVSGRADGAIEAGDLAVEPGGTVSGEVAYARLKIAAGGIIEGTVAHRGEARPAADEKPLKLVDQIESANPRRVYVDS